MATFFVILSRLGYFANGLYMLYHVLLLAEESLLLALTPIGWAVAFINALFSWPFWAIIAWTFVFMMTAAGVNAVKDDLHL